MSDRKLKITIDAVGNPTIEAEGFAGGSCREATSVLEGKFQGRNAQLDVTEKPEMYMEETGEQTISN